MKLKYFLINNEKEEFGQNFAQTLLNHLDHKHDEETFRFQNKIFTYTIEEVQKNQIYFLEIVQEDKDALDTLTQKIDSYHRPPHFKKILVYDELSEHYCDLLYPRFNKFERLLREFVWRLMMSMFGKDWIESVPTQIQDEIKGRVGRASKLDEIILYELTYDQWEQFLFSPYSDLTEKQMLAEIRFLLDSEKHGCSDEELFSSPAVLIEVNRLIQQNEPKSLWKRYFENKFDICDLEEDLKILQPNRNIVAHSKILDLNKNQTRKEEYDCIRQICDKQIHQLECVLNQTVQVEIDDVEWVEMNKHLERFYEKTPLKTAIMQHQQKMKDAVSSVYKSPAVPAVLEKVSGFGKSRRLGSSFRKIQVLSSMSDEEFVRLLEQEAQQRNQQNQRNLKPGPKALEAPQEDQNENKKE
ncbi:hypothetical protein MsAg5_04440 [Methanosarcinaceae archaeon Ag5]|uniref:Apea-like HEPN domain-containing protein n=1 Tax=Methanolapillus africanus TaxID=3028297 RepID=A0AAE4MK28_9EURY|nr:hypothetical protein [Methanosarcinaceae archaeon Ag5]